MNENATPPIDIAGLRQEYRLHALDEQDVATDPITQFNQWFAEAVKAKVEEPNAMSLATVKANGSPACRIVLLKGVEAGGFVFYTNYDSHKGQQVAANNQAALTFFWQGLERQVRIEGTIAKVPAEVSDTYFQSRPRSSRIGAWVSAQSNVIENRQVLEATQQALEARYEGQEVPRPAHWGGYSLKPVRIEFWQGRASRLHDRLGYALTAEGTWHIKRLAP